MMNFRLTYNGLIGFDYVGFDTDKEAVLWAAHQERLGLIKAKELMQYDPVKDEYFVIRDMKKQPAEVDLPNAGQNKQYYVSYQKEDIFQALIVEAPGVKTAEQYLKSKKPTAKAVSAREAYPSDFKPGIPVLALTEKEERKIRDDLLSSDLSDLDLSVRSYNTLRRKGITKIRELVCKSADQLEEILNNSWKCMDEIVSVLKDYGEALAPSEGQEMGGARHPDLDAQIAGAEARDGFQQGLEKNGRDNDQTPAYRIL